MKETKKCLMALLLASSLTACGTGAGPAESKHMRYWNEPNAEMPSGYETMCGDPDLAPPGSEMGVWATGPDWCGP